MLSMRHILAIILLFPIFAQGQTFKHSLIAGSNFSYYSSSDTEVWPTFIYINSRPVKYIDFGDFGGSLGYRLEYQLPKTLAVAISLEYLYTQATFNTRCYCNYTWDRNVNISNAISIHSIDFPLHFKLKTNAINDTYINGGIGISWLFSTHRKVDNEVYFFDQQTPQRTEIANGLFTLKNNDGKKLGTFFQVGIGQTFQIKQINFFAELSYRQDINSWLYKTIETSNGIKEFPIKRHGISLKLGVIFAQNKNDQS